MGQTFLLSLREAQNQWNTAEKGHGLEYASGGIKATYINNRRAKVSKKKKIWENLDL